MQTQKDRWQEDLFVAGTLSDLIPEDHLLKRVDGVLDLAWLHEALRDCYCQDNGRPSIDPESALRLMLAGFFEGITQDRKLMRRAQTDLAFRWFAGCRVDEKLPDHSSLTRIRQRWGAERFRAILLRTVKACVDAGLMGGGTVHVDATLVRADVSWESLTREHAVQVMADNGARDGDDDAPPPPPTRGRPRTRTPKKKRRSTTDPDATMATSCKQYHLEPTYKQHTAVDDTHGVIVDIAVETGEASEGQQLQTQIDRVEANTGIPVTEITADGAYAHAANYAALEERAITAVIPPQRAAVRTKGPQRIPARRFKYDAYHDRVKCPNGKFLTRKARVAEGNGYWYRARACDCAACPLRPRCFAEKARARSLVIVDGHPALLRARRRKEKGWEQNWRVLYGRHRWRVEGAHGRAKTEHGLRRAARRGLANMAIQAYLAAIVMNLKILVNTPRGTAQALRSVLHRMKAAMLDCTATNYKMPRAA